MKHLIFWTLFVFCTPLFLRAQHHLVLGNRALWDLKVSSQYNKPCGLADFDYAVNANTHLNGLALQHYDANGSVSAEFHYATNDPAFGNIAVSRMANLPNKQYLVASIVEQSASNTFGGGYVLLTIIDPVTGNVLRSTAVEIPNVDVHQKAIGGVVLDGATAYVVGVSATTSEIYNTQIFVVKASINLTSSVITTNWIRSYYTGSLSPDGLLPSIAYDGERGKLWVAQPDNTGKLLLFTLDAGNGAMLGQKTARLSATDIKNVKVAVVQVSKKTFSRCLITRSLNAAGNSHFTIAKLGMDAGGVPSIQAQKSYVLTGNWVMNGVDVQYPAILVGATQSLGAASKYNWFKFDMTNCFSLGNVSYKPNRQSGQSVFFGGGVFSVGETGQPGSSQLVLMPGTATCETPLTIPVLNMPMLLNAVSISNGLNLTNPGVRNVALVKLNGHSDTERVCP